MESSDQGIASLTSIRKPSSFVSPQLPPLSPVRTRVRAFGNAKKTKDREAFYKKGHGVMYLPGHINGLTKKLHLLAAEFFAGNTGSCIGRIA